MKNQDKIFDAVKMVREIRNRHYEQTKKMTEEEKKEFDRKRLESYNKHREAINLDDYDFSFLKKDEPTMAKKNKTVRPENPKGAGRKNKNATKVSIRLSNHLIHAINKICEQSNSSKTQIIEDSLKQNPNIAKFL
jgi:hypothetical protein